MLYASPPFLTLWSHYPNWTKNLLSISQLLRTCHILIRYQCHHYWHFLQIKIILTLNVNTLIMATRFPVPGPSKASNVIRHKGFSFRKNLSRPGQLGVQTKASVPGSSPSPSTRWSRVFDDDSEEERGHNHPTFLLSQHELEQLEEEHYQQLQQEQEDGEQLQVPQHLLLDPLPLEVEIEEYDNNVLFNDQVRMCICREEIISLSIRVGIKITGFTR